MTGDESRFLSRTAFDRGRVAFGNDKSGTIVNVGKTGKSLSHSIDNVYLFNRLQHNLLSMYQLCDKGNHVGFTSNQCLITNIKSGEVVLRGKRHNNVYKICVLELPQNHLTCLTVPDDDIMLWHKRPGHASLSLLNKLVSKDLVVGVPSIKYNDDNICDACAKGKQTRIAFKSKKYISTS